MDPQPTDEVLTQLYSSGNDYHTHFSENFLKQQTREFNLRIHEALKINTSLKRQALDIGATNGLFLDCAKKLGFITEGIEMNPATADIARKNGHAMTAGNFDDYETKNLFGIIHLGDIIEHVRDARATIQKCNRFLDQGGVIVVSTPNSSSFFPQASLWFARTFHLDWPHALPPAHLYQFSTKNLNMLFAQEGFTPAHLVCTNTTYMEEMRDTVYFTAIYSYLKHRKGTFIHFLKNTFLFGVAGIIYAPLWLIDEIIFLVTKKGSHVTAWYHRKSL